MTRTEILKQAEVIVTGRRTQEYGSPEDNFQVIADFWSTYMGITFKPKDVAVMMALLKVARIRSGTAPEDSYIDLAGYAACAGEIASRTASDK